MAQCPDCYSIKILSVPTEGDGKCATCYGDGYGDIISQIGGGGQNECRACNGTGQCQNCGGTGVVRD